MIRAVLIDLSGTLHVDNQAITGAVEALEKLRSTNVIVKFVTNTTKESQECLCNRLKNLGFKIEKDEIFSSLIAARKLVIKDNLKPMLLLSKDAMEDFEGLQAREDEKPNAVLVGLAPEEFHYEKLNVAFRCLLDGAKLLAVHEGRYYRRQDGLALGPGCFTTGLAYAAGCKTHLVGKPSKDFFLSAIGDLEPEQVVMIGDDVNDDISGAMEAGMKGILVQTGKYRPNDEDSIEPRPNWVYADFPQAVQHIVTQIR